MTYAVSSALQEAIYQRLSSDAAVQTALGGAVYDALPPGQLPPVFATLGAEEVRDLSDCSGSISEHRLTISVITTTPGFRGAKIAAGAISDALDAADLVLARGRLVGLSFVRASARRVQKGDIRRIDLNFRARVEETDQ